MFRLTAAPVVRTAPELSAHGAVSRGLFALVRVFWGLRNCALVGLVAGIFSALLALGASGSAHDLSVSQLPSDDSQIASIGGELAQPPKTIAIVGKDLTRVERRIPPYFDGESKAAEFEQEEEDGHSKALAAGTSSTAVQKVSRAADERFGPSTHTFVTRIGDCRGLPRGPPASC